MVREKSCSLKYREKKFLEEHGKQLPFRVAIREFNTGSVRRGKSVESLIWLEVVMEIDLTGDETEETAFGFKTSEWACFNF